MKLFTLSYGKSKKRMHPIMVDSQQKCENYLKARGERMGGGWHKIEPCTDRDVTVWLKQSATVGGNRCETVGRVGHGKAGYIGKNGFNEHT